MSRPNKVHDLGDLVLHVVRNVPPAGGTELDKSSRGIVSAGVKLQETVLRHQGVIYARDRALRYRESIGTVETPGSLDGSFPYYAHLYLIQKDGALVGISVTDLVEKVPDIDGYVRFDWFSPLINPDFSRYVYRVNPAAIKSGENSKAGLMSAFDILDNFDRHMTPKQRSGIVLRVTDGFGVPVEWLASNNYLQCEAPIWTPRTRAWTEKQYQEVLKQPVHLKGQVLQGEPRLTKDAALKLLVEEYLINGNMETDYDRAFELGLVKCSKREFERNFSFRLYEHTEAVRRTIASIEEVASKNNGYVPFRPIEAPTTPFGGSVSSTVICAIGRPSSPGQDIPGVYLKAA